MIKRIALLAILGLFPLALILAWPKLRERFTTAEIAVAVASQPREEVLLSGFMKSAGAQPFSIQTLTIEEPGKEAYRRLVSLNAESAFELTLSKPVTGKYRASILLTKAESSASGPDRWLTTPPLAVDAGRGLPIERAVATNYDRPKLLIAGGVCAAIWMTVLLVCAGTWKPKAATSQ